MLNEHLHVKCIYTSYLICAYREPDAGNMYPVV